MPFRTLKFQPGVNLERTQTLNQTQFSATNLCRFYDGLIQTLGGWQALSVDLFVGTARGLYGWSDILGNPYLAVGTEQRLEVLTGGMLFDITPVVHTSNITPAFTTTNLSASVTVLDATYSPNVNDWIQIQTQVAVGGLILFGYYLVTEVVDGTHYKINAGHTATSSVAAGGAVPAYTTSSGFATVSVLLTAHGYSALGLFDAQVSTTVASVVISGVYSINSITDANHFVITASPAAGSTTTASENGGNARIRYLLPSGYAVDTALDGYGIGDYGAGDYGIASGMQAIAPLRQWSLDNWGQDLIASPTNGGIYYWQPPTITPALILSGTAPIYNTVVFVMSQVQIIVALGAEVSGTQEPLLIRWSEAGDFTDWTPTAFNQAGSYQIPTGNKLIGGRAVGLGCVVWTDQDMWSMTYQGLPAVFGFNRIAVGCGLLTARAHGSVGSTVMWLGRDSFFTHQIGGGGVSPMECPVWDFYYQNFDRAQIGQIFCAVNTTFNEFAWFFPIDPASALYSASAPIGYVKFNYLEQGNVWDYGQSAQYQRTAWTSYSATPVGADTAGLLQQHEVGFDANGAGMQWSWTSGGFDISEGEDFSFVDMIVPDADTIGNPTIYYTVTAQLYPNRAPVVLGPFVALTSTDFIPVRVRSRNISISQYGNDLGTFNRIGAVRCRVARDGRN